MVASPDEDPLERFYKIVHWFGPFEDIAKFLDKVIASNLYFFEANFFEIGFKKNISYLLIREGERGVQGSLVLWISRSGREYRATAKEQLSKILLGSLLCETVGLVCRGHQRTKSAQQVEDHTSSHHE